MARKITVEIIGNSASLERSFGKAKASASGLNGVIGKLSIGFGQLVKGTLVVDGVHKALDGLHDTVHLGIEEFTDHAKVVAQTNAALKSTGGIANVTAKHIDELGLSLSNLSGIDDEVIQAGENVLLSFTNIRDFAGRNNDVFTRATKIMVDFAARTGRDAPAAAVLLGKALEDPAKRVGILARAGVVLSTSQVKTLKAVENTQGVLAAQKILLEQLTSRFGGAAAAAGKTLPGQLNILKDRFKDLAGAIVALAEPSFSKLVRSATKWLQNSDNQKRVMRDVQNGLKIVKEAAEALVGVYRTVAPVVQRVTAALGGTKDAVKLLAEAFVAFKAAKLLEGIGLIGTRSKSAAGEVKGLRSQLGLLATIGAITVEIDVVQKFIDDPSNKRHSLFQQIALLGPTTAAAAFDELFGKKPIKTKGLSVNQLAEKFSVDQLESVAKIQKISKETIAKVKAIQAKQAAALGLTVTNAAGVHSDALAALASRGGLSSVAGAGQGLPQPPPPPVIKRKGITADQRNTFFDNAISSALTRAGLLTNLKAQLGSLDAVSGLLSARLAKTKDITRRRNLEDQILQLAAQEQGLRQQIGQEFLDSLSFGVTKAQATAGLKDDLAALSALQAGILQRIKAEGKTVDLTQQLFDVRQQIKDTKLQQLTAKQFGELGLSPTGDTRVPFKANLKKQLGSLSEAVKGTFLDTKSTQNELGRIRKTLENSFVPVGIREKVAQMLADIRQQLKDHHGALTKTTALDTSKVLAGLGLSAADERQLRARLSHFNSAGIALAGSGSGSAAAVGKSTIVVQPPDIFLDGRKVTSNISGHQAKTRKRNPSQRRGPNAGLAFT